MDADTWIMLATFSSAYAVAALIAGRVVYGRWWQEGR